MTVWVNRPQAYELELLCCYQNILKQNSTEEKRVNKNVLKHIISSSEFSEQWNIFLIFRIQCQCKDHFQGSRDAPFQEVGTVPRSGNWRCTAGGSHASAAPHTCLMAACQSVASPWPPSCSVMLGPRFMSQGLSAPCLPPPGTWTRWGVFSRCWKLEPVHSPHPALPAVAAGRWGRFCQHFLGHCSCFWWFPVPAARSPLWTLGQAALRLGQGWLCPLLQERDRLARELRVHALHYPLQTGLRFPLLCSDRWLLSFVF